MKEMMHVPFSNLHNDVGIDLGQRSEVHTQGGIDLREDGEVEKGMEVQGKEQFLEATLSGSTYWEWRYSLR